MSRRRPRGEQLCAFVHTRRTAGPPSLVGQACGRPESDHCPGTYMAHALAAETCGKLHHTFHRTTKRKEARS